MKTITREVTARQLRSELATLVNEVAYGGGRVALHRYGSLVAVMIGMDDFQRLRRLESAPGALDAEETLDELAARLIREGRAERAAAEAAEAAAAEAVTGAAVTRAAVTGAAVTEAAVTETTGGATAVTAVTAVTEAAAAETAVTEIVRPDPAPLPSGFHAVPPQFPGIIGR